MAAKGLAVSPEPLTSRVGAGWWHLAFDKIGIPYTYLAEQDLATTDLSAFDVKIQVVHGLPVAAGYIWSTLGYGALYIAALLLAATVIFSRRDFK